MPDVNAKDIHEDEILRDIWDMEKEADLKRGYYIPHWLKMADLLVVTEHAIEINLGRKVAPKHQKSFDLLRSVVIDLHAAFQEGVGPEAEKVLFTYFKLVEKGWAKAFATQIKINRNWRNKIANGQKLGHSLYSHNWQEYWKDEWLERRPNGKGWVFSARDIIQQLPDIPMPDESTVRRYREKRSRRIGTTA
ncbi:MAG: Uncharacterised protein [Porticoccaceae bacterium UBA1117]|nr:MAG: Uncharacterised protein [Porticoccaceae bacterium UBA1117]